MAADRRPKTLASVIDKPNDCGILTPYLNRTGFFVMAINITVEQAKDIWKERSNGNMIGEISSGKGGRVWLDGEFQLCELEALCVLIRDKVGEYAQGAEELQAIWDEMYKDEK